MALLFQETMISYRFLIAVFLTLKVKFVVIGIKKYFCYLLGNVQA